jgi:hypothetical protein
MSNFLKKIQNHPSSSELTLTLPANVRLNLEKPELRALFEMCDPKAEGTISNKSVRSFLVKARASVSTPSPGKLQSNKSAP